MTPSLHNSRKLGQHFVCLEKTVRFLKCFIFTFYINRTISKSVMTIYPVFFLCLGFWTTQILIYIKHKLWIFFKQFGFNRFGQGLESKKKHSKPNMSDPRLRLRSKTRLWNKSSPMKHKYINIRNNFQFVDLYGK